MRVKNVWKYVGKITYKNELERVKPNTRINRIEKYTSFLVLSRILYDSFHIDLDVIVQLWNKDIPEIIKIKKC